MCLEINIKSLYPSRIERQNITLPLRMFDETNVIALRMYDNFDSDSETILKNTTSDFIEIFVMVENFQYKICKQRYQIK